MRCVSLERSLRIMRYATKSIAKNLKTTSTMAYLWTVHRDRTLFLMPRAHAAEYANNSPNTDLAWTCGCLHPSFTRHVRYVPSVTHPGLYTEQGHAILSCCRQSHILFSYRTRTYRVFLTEVTHPVRIPNKDTPFFLIIFCLFMPYETVLMKMSYVKK